MSVKIITGDCRYVLQNLESEGVHCVVTSPPYWGLRDYGTAKWEGGYAGCEHSVGGQVQDNKALGAILTGQRPGVDASQCRKCGARRIDSQIGLEQSPQDYVATIVGVFREVRRVLRKDGTLWLNLGDSYAAHPGQRKTTDKSGVKQETNSGSNTVGSRHVDDLKPKDLVGIPWRVAFALQADGWYLRQDIIWSKPNPMPESVRDRCTKAHEYIFLLSKSERYWYDAEAIKEPAVYGDPRNPTAAYPGKNDYREGNRPIRKSVERGNFNGKTNALPGREAFRAIEDWRNKRSVWEITTQPFPEAHFATFPPALIEPCILAGCPKGGTVLDPFGGAGTTGLVADRLERDAILVELNAEYASMAERRIKRDAPLFAQVAAE